MRRITQSSEHSSFFPGRVAISFGGCHSFFAATVDGVKYRLAVMTLSLLFGIQFATHYDRGTNEYNLDKRGNNNDSTMERYQLC